ncbi:hypothetical protein P8452_63597 [Trifolium repens]|nr:hypothetical protein P8452_63597 [Trifolium repens]
MAAILRRIPVSSTGANIIAATVMMIVQMRIVSMKSLLRSVLLIYVTAKHLIRIPASSTVAHVIAASFMMIVQIMNVSTKSLLRSVLLIYVTVKHLRERRTTLGQSLSGQFCFVSLCDSINSVLVASGSLRSRRFGFLRFNDLRCSPPLVVSGFSPSKAPSAPVVSNRSFAQALINKVDVSLTQLPKPCLKAMVDLVVVVAIIMLLMKSKDLFKCHMG